MKSWDSFLNEREKTEAPFNGEGYTLFFKKNKKYYGVKEKDRIIFAKIRTKDTKDISVDKEEIKFLARDLEAGKEVSFFPKDMKGIEVCEKEEVENNVPVSEER